MLSTVLTDRVLAHTILLILLELIHDTLRRACYIQVENIDLLCQVFSQCIRLELRAASKKLYLIFHGEHIIEREPLPTVEVSHSITPRLIDCIKSYRLTRIINEREGRYIVSSLSLRRP